MNQFFSYKRFQLLVLKHWADNKKRYGLSVLAFIGLLIIWFVFTILVNEVNKPMEVDMQMITFFLAMFATGCFYASQYFRDLGSKAKGSNFMLVPASAFEKIICGLLYTVVLYFIVFTAAFYLVDYLMVTIVNAFPANQATQKATVINIFHASRLPFNTDTTINFMLIFFLVQSAFLLGAVYFKKYSFLKTIISGFVGCFIIFCLIYFFNEHVLPVGDYSSGFFTTYRVHVDDINDRVVSLPDWIGRAFRFIVLYVIAPFLWIVTYFRLKEKQV